MDKNLTKSLETYLSAIDTLLAQKESVIVKDVANFLKLGGASTADGVKKLKEKGYINYEPYGNITLTSLGEDTVCQNKLRHKTIKNFLNKVLDIDIEGAELNANAIEYSMTKDVLDRFVHFVNFMEQCYCSEPKWLKSCKSSLKDGKIPQKCNDCSGNCTCSKK